mmetsp:Transcript_163400/g.523953  ORF Transcript_163400/g.523953 Transcript_163400/m.523953 type:complete len:305 (+) Transcript_163400:712-1626(+)
MLGSLAEHERCGLGPGCAQLWCSARSIGQGRRLAEGPRVHGGDATEVCCVGPLELQLLDERLLARWSLGARPSALGRAPPLRRLGRRDLRRGKRRPRLGSDHLRERLGVVPARRPLGKCRVPVGRDESGQLPTERGQLRLRAARLRAARGPGAELRAASGPEGLPAQRDAGQRRPAPEREVRRGRGRSGRLAGQSRVCRRPRRRRLGHPPQARPFGCRPRSHGASGHLRALHGGPAAAAADRQRVHGRPGGAGLGRASWPRHLLHRRSPRRLGPRQWRGDDVAHASANGRRLGVGERGAKGSRR